jgi:hypothetical protein
MASRAACSELAKKRCSMSAMIGLDVLRLFDADRAALLTEIVLAIGQRFGVNFDEFHNDSTTVSFYGS